MSYTPGPWEWDGNVWQYDSENEAPWLVQAPWSSITSKPVLMGTIKCESESDARLISAAPELLEALKGVLRWMPVYPDAADGIVGGREAHKAAIDAARAAIAKAEGAK